MARKPTAEDNQAGPMPVDAIMAALPDLEIGELVQLIEAAQRQLGDKRRQARDAFVQRVWAEAEALELDPATLFTSAPAATKAPAQSGQKRGAVAVKYKGPAGEVWSGRGKEPTWLTALIAKGHAKDDYLVKPPNPAAE